MDDLGVSKTHHILGNPQKNGTLTHHGSFTPFKIWQSHLQELLLWHRKGLEKLMAQSQRGRRARGRRWRRKPQQFCRCFLGQIVPKKPKRYSFLGREMGPLISGFFCKFRLMKYYNLARSLHLEYLEISVGMAFLSRFNKSQKWAQRKVTSIHTIHTGLGVRALVFSKVGFCR